MDCKQYEEFHNFEPRYDEAEELPDLDFTTLIRGGKTSQIIASAKLRKKTYIYDICTKCGKIVKNE